MQLVDKTNKIELPPLGATIGFSMVYIQDIGI